MAADPLYTVAFLDLEAAASSWLQAVRRQHDPQAGLVDAHFTLLFGVTDVPQATYLAHVAAVARESAPIDFRCRQVQPWARPADAQAHLFLVPDEGHDALVDLHDRLYRGPLAPQLRPDLPYLPHVTLGRAQGFERAQVLCAALQAEAPAIRGRLGALTVGALRPQRFEPLAVFALGV
jgi:2'-5' RNA ligase